MSLAELLPLLVMTGLALAALGLHIGALRALPSRTAIGDETDYLARSRWPDPHEPRNFLRVPLVPWLVAAVGRRSADAESALRAGGSVLGAMSAMLAALAGFQLGGWLPGLLAGAAMLLLAERVVLATHLWPDTLLCTLHAAVLLLLLMPMSPALALGLGLLAALAAMARIEQLALLAGLGLYLLWLRPAQLPLHLVMLLGPSLLALAVWTGVAWRRYRIALPDTTWLFNLRILDRQLETAGAGATDVQGSIASLLRDRDGQAGTGALLGRMLARPFAFGVSVLRRLLACAGPDTFVTGRLLPPLGRAYPSMSQAQVAWLAPMLRWGFPVLVLLCAWSLWVTAAVPAFLVVAVPVLLALTVVHFRSRYRLVLAPWLCVATGQALAMLDFTLLEQRHLLALLLLPPLAWLLVRFPAVVEHPSQSGGGLRTSA